MSIRNRTDSIRLRVHQAKSFWSEVDQQNKLFVLQPNGDPQFKRKSVYRQSSISPVNYSAQNKVDAVIFNKFNPYARAHPELSHRATIILSPSNESDVEKSNEKSPEPQKLESESDSESEPIKVEVSESSSESEISETDTPELPRRNSKPSSSPPPADVIDDELKDFVTKTKKSNKQRKELRMSAFNEEKPRNIRASSIYDLSALRAYEAKETDSFAPLRRDLSDCKVPDYWCTIANEVAKLATDADDQEKYQDAIELYKTATGYYQQASQTLTNSKEKLDEVNGKIHDYTNRIEWIQRELKDVPEPGGKRRMTFYWNGFFDPEKEVVASPKITPQKKMKKQLHKSFFEFLGQNTNNKRQRNVELQLTVLIGKPLTWTSNPTSEEDWCHQKLLQLRLQTPKENQVLYYSHPTVTNVNTTSGPFAVKIVLPTKKTLVLACTSAETPAQIIGKAFQTERKNVDLNKYIIRVPNRMEYLDNHTPLIKFKYVNKQIKEGKEVELQVEEMSNVGIVATSDEELISHDEEVEITFQEMEGEESKYKDISDLNQNFTFKIHKCEFTPAATEVLTKFITSLPYVVFTCDLFHGDQLLGSVTTRPHRNTKDRTIGDRIEFELPISHLPFASRICITLYCCSRRKEEKEKWIMVGWSNVLLFDHKNLLRKGTLPINLWVDREPEPFGASTQNEMKEVEVILEFPEFSHFILYSLQKDFISKYSQTQSSESEPSLSRSRLGKLDSILRKDSLERLSSQEKELIWENRSILVNIPESLPKFLSSFFWTLPEKVEEALKLMVSWAPLKSGEALELLSWKFPDPRVRQFAVAKLESVSNDELTDYLPQLIQVLKHENYHYSPLACLILKKALSDLRLGVLTFWYLRSEIHGPHSRRYQILLEAYLLGCGNSVRTEIMKQDGHIGMLTSVCHHLKDAKSFDRDQVFKQEIQDLELNQTITLPLEPTVTLQKLIPERSKYFESKTVPLLLTFEDTLGNDYRVIFKAGDDLRQDALILQMIKLMDKMWKSCGLELAMTPYGILATGPDHGLIEVVNQCKTIVDIQMEQGGATAAFNKKCIYNWLKDNAEDNFHENFMKSTAGYCVCTYLLGIGDRHNDNILLSKDGRLFHIDFGKVLGHWQTFAGISRDRVPFVFTKDFAYVIDRTESYEKTTNMLQLEPSMREFVTLCCNAFNIIRKNAHIFINLFALTLSTGISELKSEEDISYFRESLCLSMTDEEAAEFFTKMIWKSLNSKSTQLNFFVHNVANRKTKR